jgi:hypothetical protein
MRLLLQAQECWELVDLGYVESDLAVLISMTNAQRIAQATMRNKENKEKFWIHNSVDDSIFSKSQALVLQNRPGTSLNLPTKEMTGSK